MRFLYPTKEEDADRSSSPQNASDIVQDLTHNLCYPSERATKSVSICPAACYANLVYERARCYLFRLCDPSLSAGSSAQSVDSSGHLGQNADLSQILVHTSVRISMSYN